MVYYGVFLSAPSIGGNMYLNFFLASLVELPAIPAGVWIYNRLVIIGKFTYQSPIYCSPEFSRHRYCFKNLKLSQSMFEINRCH